MLNCFEAVGQLRRHDHQPARLRLDQERRIREAHRLDQEDRERERKELLWRAATAPLWEALQARSAESLAQILSPGEPGRQPASMLNDLNLNLAPGTWTNRTQSPPQSTPPIQPNQTESNPIKPNQTSPPAWEASPQAQPNRHPTEGRRKSLN